MPLKPNAFKDQPWGKTEDPSLFIKGESHVSQTAEAHPGGMYALLVSSGMMGISPISLTHRANSQLRCPHAWWFLTAMKQKRKSYPAAARRTQSTQTLRAPKEAFTSFDRTWNNLGLWREACFMLRTWVIFLPVIFPVWGCPRSISLCKPCPSLNFMALLMFSNAFSFPESSGLWQQVRPTRCVQSVALQVTRGLG